MGFGTNCCCPQVEEDPLGPCCLPSDQFCNTIETKTNCELLGGTFKGTWCCFPGSPGNNDDCNQNYETQTLCEEAGGIWKVINTCEELQALAIANDGVAPDDLRRGTLCPRVWCDECNEPFIHESPTILDISGVALDPGEPDASGIGASYIFSLNRHHHETNNIHGGETPNPVNRNYGQCGFNMCNTPDLNIPPGTLCDSQFGFPPLPANPNINTGASINFQGNNTLAIFLTQVIPGIKQRTDVFSKNVGPIDCIDGSFILTGSDFVITFFGGSTDFPEMDFDNIRMTLTFVS